MILHIVILAAGLGKRMLSKTPKVLHQLAHKPLLTWVYETALTLHPDCIHVVYGHGGEEVQEALADLKINWVHQEKQLGTGHALEQALAFIPDGATVLVLSADVPLIQTETLKALLAVSHGHLCLLTAHMSDPTGLGRIVRDESRNIQYIIEEKDADETSRQIKEIYTGICAVKSDDLKRWLPKLHSNNAQQEFYLTDIIAMAAIEGQKIHSILVKDLIEIQGVNNRLQLHELERAWQKKKAEQLLLAGVQIADASRFDLRGDLICGQDVYIDINCIFKGRVVLGDGCRIGPNAILADVILGDYTEILPNTLLEGVSVGMNCMIGPFARLRPGTHLNDDCKIGNFVETKKVRMDKGSKASHLTYLGDAIIGKDVNIGAGTITCNYDGIRKYQTIIEDEVFVGSGTKLVAPVTLGARSTVGAGTVIRKDIPSDVLAVSDSKQRTILGWKRKQKTEAK